MDTENARRPYSYRESRNTLTRMSAIRLGPQKIELAIQAWDLCKGSGQAFLRKYHEAMKDHPKQLVVYVSCGPTVSRAGIALLTWAQANCELHNVEFVLSPASAELRSQCQAAGLADTLQIQAA